jgi:hypothetical protein
MMTRMGLFSSGEDKQAALFTTPTVSVSLHAALRIELPRDLPDHDAVLAQNLFESVLPLHPLLLG